MILVGFIWPLLFPLISLVTLPGIFPPPYYKIMKSKKVTVWVCCVFKSRRIPIYFLNWDTSSLIAPSSGPSGSFVGSEPNTGIRIFLCWSVFSSGCDKILANLDLFPGGRMPPASAVGGAEGLGRDRFSVCPYSMVVKRHRDFSSRTCF